MPTKKLLRTTKDNLKEKTVLFVMWNCEYKEKYLYQNWYLPMKDVFKEVLLFDPKKRIIAHGPEKMKEELLDTVKKVRPDVILLTVWGCGEFESLDLPEQLREVSKESKIVCVYADDDRDFEISSRYYAPLMDYNLVIQPDFTEKYIKEGNKAFTIYAVDAKVFTPPNLEKKYDVSFIGAPSPPRLKTMKFLIDNGVNLSLWGRGWLEHPEFQKVYRGEADAEEFKKFISQTKINIGFSKNKDGLPHYKARVLEVGALGAFSLVDYFKGYTNFFIENKEIAMFKDDSDLLQKIKYYLKNEKERELVAKNAYKKIIAKLDMTQRVKEVFTEIFKDKNVSFPGFNTKDKKVYNFTKDEISQGIDSAKNKLKEYDYVTFEEENIIPHQYKKDIQIYSLEKSGKEISCCDYYIKSKTLGNILRFRVFHAFKNINRETFNQLLNLNQLMVSKNYFLSNFDKINGVFEGEIIDFVDNKNTAFVDTPLLKIEKVNSTNLKGINSLGGKSLSRAFQLNFVLKLYSKMSKKKILADSYIYNLLIYSAFSRNISLLNYLFNSVFNKENWAKLKSL